MKALRVLLIIVVIIGGLILWSRHQSQVRKERKLQEAAAKIEAGRHPRPRAADPYSAASKQSSDQLYATFQNPNAMDRLTAMQVLAERKDPRIHEALRSMLAKKDADASDAAQALGYYQDPADFDALRTIAIVPPYEGNAYLSRAAAESLGRLHDARALPVLLSLWKDSGDDRVPHGAARGLGLYGPEGLALLLKRLNKKDIYGSLQQEVADGVAAATTANVPGALPALIDIYQNHSLASARQHTIAALALRQEPEAQDAFRQAMHDKDANVRRAVVEALKPDDPRAVDLLKSDLTDPDKYIQQSIGKALFAIDTPASCAVLDQAMADKDLGIIAGSYDRFLPIQNPAHIQVLIDALNLAGDQAMASTLLNDSHPELSKAAEEWASANHYQIEYRPVQR